LIRLKDSYDWVVIGDNPGALLTASIVARMRLSVIVLPFSPGCKLTVSDDGRYIDPEANYLVGLDRSEMARGLLAECLIRSGALPSELCRISHDSAFLQILTPQHRVWLAHDHDALAREMDREFGNKASARIGLSAAMKHAELPVLSFWRGLPDRLTVRQVERKNVKSPQNINDVSSALERSRRTGDANCERSWFLPNEKLETFARQVNEPGFLEFCNGLVFGGAETKISDVSLFEALNLFILGRTGGGFQGGMSAYRQLLLLLARRMGAHIPDDVVCKRIFIEGGRLVGVQASHRGAVMAARGAVLGCALESISPIVSASGSALLGKLRKSPVKSGWRFTLALSVKREAIPVGMKTRSVWSEAGAPFCEIELAEPADYGSTQPEKRWIFARTIMPFNRESLQLDAQRMVAARLLRHLTQIMPFVDDHIVSIYPDFRAKNDELSQVFGFATLEQIPENLCCYLGDGVGSSSGVEGLFVVNSESFPRLGSFGPTVAALEACAWIAHRNGLVGPFA
jgi:hypothetical protein